MNAERCGHCPAVFTKPGGWRPVSDTALSNGSMAVSVTIWLLIAPVVVVAQVLRFRPLFIALACFLIFSIGLANRLSKRRSVHAASGAFGCLLAVTAVAAIAAVALILLAMVSSR